MICVPLPWLVSRGWLIFCACLTSTFPLSSPPFLTLLRIKRRSILRSVPKIPVAKPTSLDFSDQGTSRFESQYLDESRLLYPSPSWRIYPVFIQNGPMPVDSVCNHLEVYAAH